MKVVILAGGFGTRLSEETEVKPKPMVEIGGQPILWHIMKHYAHHGFNEFAVALGYKGKEIKEYFLDYHPLHADLTINLKSGETKVHGKGGEDWTVHLADTGMETMTGGRIRRLSQWIGNEPFMVTYGDGVADLNLRDLLAFHEAQGKIATVTAVRPPSRFGGIHFDGNLVDEFTEKPQIGEGWINGGYMIFQPEVLKRISGDEISLERDVLEALAARKELAAFRHEGFWQCMDTLRDKHLLEDLWRSGKAPWHIWQ